jgi:adenosylmethionine-8-amino-7-oxononanoate aminotransferase
VIASKRVVDGIAAGSGAFLHGFTYNAHPVSVAAGRAVLKRIRSQNLVHASDSNAPGTAGSALKNGLASLRDVDAVGDVRGLGLLWGVEFVADKKTKAPFPAARNFAGAVGQACAHRGLLVYPMQGCVDGIAGDHLLIAPPAVISSEQIVWAVEQIRSAVKAALQS